MASRDEPVDVERQGEREVFGRALSRALARIDRRIAAIKSDLAKADVAGTLADRAPLFVASAAAAARGIRILTAVDWSTGVPVQVEMALDPSKGAREQVTALFKRARRLREGTPIARGRLVAAEAAATKLRDLSLALASSDSDVAMLEAQARRAAPRDFARAVSTVVAAARPRGQPSPRPPYRKFVGADDRSILVGRNAASNDELTLHVARPRDLWLHAKNWTGAHVVVPLDKGTSCPPDLLVQAAHLAAHFSDARDERLVEVTYAPRRYIRKPRGSPPGAVVVDRENVLVLRKKDDTIRKLLESEVEI